jgi:predicted naringenin-chalcone synthase
MAAYASEAPEIAAPACAEALDEARWTAASVTHLVTASCTGFEAPGVDLALLERLGMSRTVRRTHIGFMGCHAAINALRIADALARCGERVLLCCVELCSLHLRYRPTADQVVANALFADGAAAAVVGPADRGLARIRATASAVFPGTRDAMSWRVGDFGFEMRLDQSVPDHIRAQARPWIDEWLTGHGLRTTDIASWCIHPGGPRVLTAVEEALGIGHGATLASRDVLARHGNMSSATALFILREQLSPGWRGPGLMISFGPGLSAEAALLD